jgi:hypothetical protein
MNRRELLKAGVSIGVTLSGINVISGHTAAETPKNNITLANIGIIYKLSPPKEGCMVGFYRPHTLGRSVPSLSLDHYISAFGIKPSLYALWQLLSEGFPMVEARIIKDYGVVPYLNIYPGVSAQQRWKPIYDPNDIVKGRCDSYLKRIAKDALLFGEKHGGFFIAAIVEFNAEWWPWSRKPDTTPSMRHIWQIFEDHGANQYATWVWEAFCPKFYERRVQDPEPYYPGDKYVDWIGMNVFANLKNPNILENTMFRDILSPTYEQMTKNHPQKPMMVSEFGRTPGQNQPSWLIDAFRSIKNEFPRIKAAIYYDNITNVYGGQDHTLDSKSLNTLKEVFIDPYWIMVK